MRASLAPHSGPSPTRASVRMRGRRVEGWLPLVARLVREEASVAAARLWMCGVRGRIPNPPAHARDCRG